MEGENPLVDNIVKIQCQPEFWRFLILHWFIKESNAVVKMRSEKKNLKNKYLLATTGFFFKSHYKLDDIFCRS